MTQPLNEVTDSALRRAAESVKPFSSAIARAKSQAGPGAIVLAWLSDMHIHAPSEYATMDHFYTSKANSEVNFAIALSEIRALDPAPDLLVLGGDLTDTNRKEQWAEFARLLNAYWPSDGRSLPIRGNHDGMFLEPGERTFEYAYSSIRRPDWPTPVVSSGLYYETSVGGWRFLVIDCPDCALGVLDEPQRKWLVDRLSAPNQPPTVILNHLPMVACGNWVDRYNFRDRPSLAAIEQSNSVRILLSGHTHMTAAWQYRRKIHVIFPACAYGIGDTCGWGCVVLAADHVHSIFVKEIAGPTFDYVPWTLEDRPGNFRQLEALLYENSVLLDPVILPRHDEPSERN